MKIDATDISNRSRESERGETMPSENMPRPFIKGIPGVLFALGIFCQLAGVFSLLLVYMIGSDSTEDATAVAQIALNGSLFVSTVFFVTALSFAGAISWQ
ncbi:hypothetical protein [Planctomicrobium sp. SH527]|uniref:hypothetical protein n=1 Tax=Planctomicrobium sp. SH527 TaxID=3448123 RepID=UPI003F5C8F30